MYSKHLSICSFSYLKAASYKRVWCVRNVPLSEEVPVQFWPNVPTKRPRPFHFKRCWPTHRALSGELCSSLAQDHNNSQDINQIFFPLSSQHHNVTTRCRPLAYHDHVLVNESAISPTISLSDPISSYKSTFVGVILGHSTLALSISTPPDALTSCFSDKYPLSLFLMIIMAMIMIVMTFQSFIQPVSKQTTPLVFTQAVTQRNQNNPLPMTSDLSNCQTKHWNTQKLVTCGLLPG